MVKFDCEACRVHEPGTSVFGFEGRVMRGHVENNLPCYAEIWLDSCVPRHQFLASESYPFAGNQTELLVLQSILAFVSPTSASSPAVKGMASQSQPNGRDS